MSGCQTHKAEGCMERRGSRNQNWFLSKGHSGCRCWMYTPPVLQECSPSSPRCSLPHTKPRPPGVAADTATVPVSRGRWRAPLCVPAMVSPSPSSCDSSRTAVSCSPSILDALWEMTPSSVRVSRTGCCLVDLQEQRTLPVRSLVACACPQEGKPFSLGHC